MSGCYVGKRYPIATSHYKPVRRRDASKKDERIPAVLESADKAWLMERKQLLANLIHMYRNDEYLSGTIDQFLDAEIGSHYRCEPNINGQALGYDPKTTADLNSKILERWNLFSHGKGNWIDIARKQNGTRLFRGHSRAGRIFGEGFAVIRNLDRKKTNRPWGTCIQLLDPCRVDTPPEHAGSDQVIAGIHQNEFGEELGIYVADGYPDTGSKSFADLRSIGNGRKPLSGQMKYSYVPREDSTGRPMFVHSYVEDLPGLSRGVPVFASALMTLVGLKQLDVITAKRAAWTACIGAVVESDYSDAEDVLVHNEETGGFDRINGANYHMGQGLDWAGEDGYNFGEVQGKRLWSGEKAKFYNPVNEAANQEVYERGKLRRFGRGQGMSTEMVMQDWSKTNFSGQRAGMIPFDARIQVDRTFFPDDIANKAFCAFVEEDILLGGIQLPGFKRNPKGAFKFFLRDHNRDHLTRVGWYGPIRQEIDEKKKLEKFKLLQDMDYLLDEQMGNEILGRNWREFHEQRAREKQYAAQCEQQFEESVARAE